jgi:hypothetical protein
MSQDGFSPYIPSPQPQQVKSVTESQGEESIRFLFSRKFHSILNDSWPNTLMPLHCLPSPRW